jgi:Cu+-exporting ATPase
MYRIAKDIRKGVLMFDVTTTAVAGRKRECVIVVIHLEPVEALRRCPSSMRIYDFLKKYDIDIDIACAALPITKEEVVEAIGGDSVARVADLQDVLEEVLSKCDDRYYVGIGIMVDVESQRIFYALSSGGKLFPHAKKVIKALQNLGVDVYIASGDRQLDIERLADCIGVPRENAFGLSTPLRKREIVDELKQGYDVVIMVGDGLNDVLAFEAADVAVLTLQQESERPRRLFEAADRRIERLEELIPIVKEFI